MAEAAANQHNQAKLPSLYQSILMSNMKLYIFTSAIGRSLSAASDDDNNDTVCLKLINNIRYFYYFYCILAAVSKIWGTYANFKTPNCLDKIFHLKYVLNLIFIYLNNSLNEKLYFTDSAQMEMGILAYL